MSNILLLFCIQLFVFRYFSLSKDLLDNIYGRFVIYKLITKSTKFFPSSWKGKANKLTEAHKHTWSIIEQISEVCERQQTAENRSPLWLPHLQRHYSTPSSEYYSMAAGISAGLSISTPFRSTFNRFTFCSTNYTPT